MSKSKKRLYIPWISKDDKDEIESIIENTIVAELKKRFWGDWASGSSPGGVKRIIINDYRGLMLAIGTIRYFMNKHNTKIFYRGQSKDWPLKPSLFRDTTSKKEQSLNISWNKEVLTFLEDKFDRNGFGSDHREALLQHYGMKTTWFDVVDHIQTACWFAYHDTSQHKYDPFDNENSIESDVGFIYLLCTPEKENDYAKYIDIRNKPSEWLRPHVQQAYAIRSNDPLSFGTFMNHLCIITFVIPQTFLKQWSNIDVITKEIIYPHCNHDRGIKHFNAAMEKLKSEKISISPPI